MDGVPISKRFIQKQKSEANLLDTEKKEVKPKKKEEKKVEKVKIEPTDLNEMDIYDDVDSDDLASPNSETVEEPEKKDEPLAKAVVEPQVPEEKEKPELKPEEKVEKVIRKDNIVQEKKIFGKLTIPNEKKENKKDEKEGWSEYILYGAGVLGLLFLAQGSKATPKLRT